MKTLNEYNREQEQIRAELRKSLQRKANVACDRCATEMVYSSELVTMLSIPPKKAVHCPKCRHRGYKQKSATPIIATFAQEASRG